MIYRNVTLFIHISEILFLFKLKKMLLSKRKIQTIHKLFKAPYKPSIKNILSQNENIAKMSMEFKNSINILNTIDTNSRKYYNKSQVLNKSNFLTYNNYNNNQINHSHNYTNYTLSYDTISYDTSYYQSYYPLKREIIIRNPEEIIQSGVLKGSVKKNILSSDIYQNQNIKQNEVNPGLNYVEYPKENKVEEIKETEKFSEDESAEDKEVKEKDLEKKEINLLEMKSVNSLKKLETKETYEIDNEIQGKNTDSIKLEKENDLEVSDNSILS